MFGAVIMEGTPKRKICLMTRRGTSIDNYQATPGGDAEEWDKYLVEHRALDFKVRRGATGYYNCAGLVWANRRTSVDESRLYQQILEEDGYRKLDQSEPPTLGDVAVYRFEHDQRIWHVGLVAYMHREPASIALGARETTVPYVLSKWSDWGGETYHHAQRFPKMSGCVTRVEYWRDQ